MTATGEKRKFGPEVYSALIDEAHQHGKKAIAHIYQLADAKGVVRAGADGTAHMVRAPGPDDELLRLLTDNDVFVFTSMSIQKAGCRGPRLAGRPAPGADRRPGVKERAQGPAQPAAEGG